MLKVCFGGRKSSSIAIFSVSVFLSGCATTWHNPSIGSGVEQERQLVIDRGYCKQASYGAVPMPQVKYNSDGSSQTAFSGQSTTQNTYTGASSQSDFSGTATTTPSVGGAFAAGAANGMNIGAAINARNAREEAFKACMYAKGWSEGEADPSKPDKEVRPEDEPQVSNYSNFIDRIYSSVEDRWEDEIREFRVLYPAYGESERLGQIFDSKVRRIARSESAQGLSGSQILLRAHNEMTSEGYEVVGLRSNLVEAYGEAVAGDASAANDLALLYAQGDGPLPVNMRRAAFWACGSAMSGDVIGEFSCGILLFEGNGLESDRVLGYQLVETAANKGVEQAGEALSAFEGRMSASELRAVGL